VGLKIQENINDTEGKSNASSECAHGY